jgi:hypothetical protein
MIDGMILLSCQEHNIVDMNQKSQPKESVSIENQHKFV